MNFGTSINLSKQILDYSNSKNNVIANNLSNINNPNYKRKYMEDLTFSTHLENEMKKTREGHISDNTNINNSMEIKTELSKGRNDENNVNLDKEIIDLTSNQYLFNISTSILQREYTKLREAII